MTGAPTPTRWAGVPLTDRRAERRALLVDAAFRLFGDGGEAALSVRSVCRECGLNTRYFYESFADTDDLLGAVYDQVSAALAADVDAAMAGAGESVRSRTRAGIAAVLGFSSADPRRGRVLFTDARANPVLAARRTATQDLLREAVLSEGGRLNPGSDPVAAQVGAAMYTGAMAELAQQWLSGNLGDDLESVVDYALRLVLGR
ncbi:TetR family transcriptional regulator [Mycolicibacterium conceptionense]|uniref:TetR family transcriptional regulator n=1 Tax=Mycolicibacterium conceptionense TaxID=451644 RepID=A0A1A1W4R3_9MYCO|nr:MULTISPECIES: TetR/AcrR family transcriptional regulator [Mycolicibacterium]MCW1819778.1 TetR/AcrR family transcriptional regulator [Mycolicibacterium senegalense]OBB04603.1 TetR family transcriptional regulator [Mycolicibacterium conceptionense]OBF01794.1 TetR family transcriptional regulator [Mycolicibacterium conceptionense]OBF22076.1 TetR family transcriptional regulator [Mycolicibacterium conceptionense]OBF34574.1 TetR family transcriptional regulator [Mycolicibacterium conceptionense]